MKCPECGFTMDMKFKEAGGPPTDHEWWYVYVCHVEGCHTIVKVLPGGYK